MKTKYESEDGKLFDTIHACLEHEQSLVSKADEAYTRFINTFRGRLLTKNHRLNEAGTWQVCGEDPNCDMGGSHHNPYLATYSGTLENVIRKAVTLHGFWQWGAGGDIKKVSVEAV